MSDKNLPVQEYLPFVCQSLRENGTLVLTAATGSGKTTMVPVAVSSELVKDKGVTYVLQPRRLACIWVCRYLAEKLGEKPGESIGYHVRYDRKESSRTRILFLTEGMFVRRLLSDPSLEKVACIIHDEFHERNLYGDLSFALTRKILNENRGRGFFHLIMSATIESDEIARKLSTTALSIPGRTFGVDLKYLPARPKESLSEHLLRSLEVLQNTTEYGQYLDGNILIFLRGVYEIQAAKSFLTSRFKGFKKYPKEIVGMWSDMSTKAQGEILSVGSKKQFVILSTNVAETSLTIPGVRVVIDAGLENRSAFSSWNGMASLERTQISKASAEQRKGRAGRTSNGLCLRLYSEADYARMEAQTPSQVSRSDLASFLIQTRSAIRGDQDLFALDWLENPNRKNFDQAAQLLEDLGALGPGLSATQESTRFAASPFHPRITAVLNAAERLGIKELALVGCAIIEEKGVLGASTKISFASLCDLRLQILLLLSHWGSSDALGFFEVITPKSSKTQDHPERLIPLLDRSSVGRVERSLDAQLKRGTYRQQSFQKRVLQGFEKNDLLTEALFSGFYDCLARVMPKSEKLLERKEDFLGENQKVLYSFCLGRGGMLSSVSTQTRSEYIIVLSGIDRPGKRQFGATCEISMATTIPVEFLLMQHKHRLYQEETLAEELTVKKKKVTQTSKVVKFGSIVLSQEVCGIEKTREFSKLQTEQKIQELKKSFPEPFMDASKFESFSVRLAFATKSGDCSNLFPLEGEELELMLAEVLDVCPTKEALSGQEIIAWYKNLVSYDDWKNFEKFFPEVIVLPNGRRLAIDYTNPRGPTIASKLQDFFCCQDHPSIANGKTPLVVELLAPSRRPIQVTSDIIRFWQGSYEQVRKEMKQRYPKHDWPPVDQLKDFL